MKKGLFLFFIIIALALSSCRFAGENLESSAPSPSLNNANIDDGAGSNEKELVIRTVKYDYFPWEEKVGDGTDKLCIDADTARSIADAIWSDTFVAETKVEVYVIEDAPDIFVVSRYHEDMLGGASNIAINKRTCEIIKFWDEE